MKRCETGRAPLVAAAAAVMTMARNAEQPLHRRMKTDWGQPDPAELAKRAKVLADEGAIGPGAALATGAVHLFSGTEDRTGMRLLVEQLASQP